MNNYTSQYTTVLWLSWIILYLFFPTWISKHSIFPSLDQQMGRTLLVSGMVIYFSVSAWLVSLCFNKLGVNKPFIVKVPDIFRHIKENIWLVIICCISAVLHIDSFSLGIVVGEESFLTQTFWMYEVINSYSRGLFNLPIQYLFWSMFIILTLVLTLKKTRYFITGQAGKAVDLLKSSSLARILFAFFILAIINLYSYIFPYYSHIESLTVIRYPPVTRYLYLIIYSAFGLSHQGPRILQLLLYMLGAVYLYRTILLFNKKDPALFGAAIYLFSPILFNRASSAAAESGSILFIILVSFYFLRFLKNADSRDLILATYFIGIGFLYKRGLLIMALICLAFLVLDRIKKRDLKPIMHFFIILTPFIPILPYMMIGTGNPVALSNLFNVHELIRYLTMLESQLSLMILILFLISFVFMVFMKRDNQSLFFGLLFTAYYLLFTIMHYGPFNHRYAMALYPAIAVLTAQFVFNIVQNLKMKHAFKIISTIITVYLVVLCVLPRSSSSLITYEYEDFEIQHYPWDKAIEWINTRTEKDKKILGVYLTPDFRFHYDNINNDRDKIMQSRIYYIGQSREEYFYPFENLIAYCNKEKISYIVLRYGPNNSYTYSDPFMLRVKVMKHLKENFDLDNEYNETARFNEGDNYIIIYKRIGGFSGPNPVL